MAQRLAAIAALLAAPSLALAQTSGVTVTENADQDNIVNRAECLNDTQDNLTITWSVSGFTAPFTISSSDQSGCPVGTTNSTTTATTKPIGTTSNTSFVDTQTVSQRIQAIFGAGCPSTAAVLFICITDSSSTPVTVTGSITLDLATPPPPVANTPTPGDTALNVSWSQGTGSADGGTGSATGYNIYCDVHPATSPIAKKCGSVTGSGTTDTRITGLTNGTEYDVEVTALSQGSNESGHSNTVSGTPVEILDFWRLYRQDGGREQGGCAAGAGGLAALLALLPLAWRRRRRRR